MKTYFKKLNKLWRNKWLFGSVIAITSVFFGLLFGALYDNLELKSYDIRFAIRGPQKAIQDSIVIVAIDEQSIVSLKTWPFPRSYFAHVVRNLHKAGARLIVIDVEFAELSSKEGRDDLWLAGAIKRAGNVILSGEFVAKMDERRGILNTYVTPPHESFLRTGAQWGIINSDEDYDGFTRRYTLFQVHNRKAYLPLSMKAYLHLKNKSDQPRLQFNDERYFSAEDLRIPKIYDNSMLINFRGPEKTFPTYSFEEALDDSVFKLPDEEDSDSFEQHRIAGTFKNKIVFIGASAEVLNDNKLTPFFKFKGSRKTPGVEVHANALSNFLRKDFIHRQGFLSSFLVVLLLSASVLLLTKTLKPMRGLVAVASLILFYLVVSVYFFINHLLWVDIIAPFFTIAFCFIGNIVHQALTEQRERIRIKKSWEQYMSKDIIDTMLASGELPKFGGERREMTVLFSDIRGFTSFSENHSSNQVVRTLREYLTEMVDVIQKNAGTLDKFVGDEIMALYGAPYYYEDHAQKACFTALEMIRRLRALQKKWSSLNKEWFEIGIGINSGKVILGNLGSSQHFDYTIIGDDVNLGARLEGANKQYGTTIILSEATKELVGDIAKVRELDVVRVKGKKRPVKIYELRDMEELPSIEQDLIIDIYSEGLDLYKKQQFYQATKEFKRVLRYFPTDGPTRVYIKRCLDFIESPPPDEWDGVYDFTTK